MNAIPNRAVSRRQLLEQGIPARRIESMVRSGDLRTVFRGVYLGHGVEDSLEARAQAAALVLGDDQVICDRAAAFLHGVDAYGAREARSRPMETCVLRGGARTRRRGIDGRERDLASSEIMRLGSVRLTTPLRTALDLGCSLPRHRALAAMDELARRHGFDGAELNAGARRYRRRRGVVQLRELVVLVNPKAESPRESWVRLDIADAGLPAPTLQWWVIEDGVAVWRLDLAYPAHRVAIEYDGEEFHRRTPEQIAHDGRRRDWLRSRGWAVIVVTMDDLRDRNSGWLLALRDALEPQTRRFRWELGRGN